MMDWLINLIFGRGDLDRDLKLFDKIAKRLERRIREADEEEANIEVRLIDLNEAKQRVHAIGVRATRIRSKIAQITE